MKPIYKQPHHSTERFWDSVILDDVITLDIVTEFGSKTFNGGNHSLVVIQTVAFYWKKKVRQWNQPVTWILFPLIYANKEGGKWEDATETHIEELPTLDLRFDMKQKNWVPIEENWFSGKVISFSFALVQHRLHSCKFAIIGKVL